MITSSSVGEFASVDRSRGVDFAPAQPTKETTVAATASEPTTSETQTSTEGKTTAKTPPEKHQKLTPSRPSLSRRPYPSPNHSHSLSPVSDPHVGQEWRMRSSSNRSNVETYDGYSNPEQIRRSRPGAVTTTTILILIITTTIQETHRTNTTSSLFPSTSCTRESPFWPFLAPNYETITTRLLSRPHAVTSSVQQPNQLAGAQFPVKKHIHVHAERTTSQFWSRVQQQTP